MQHILVLTGEIGAGKSAISDYLSGWYRAGKYKFSHPIRRMLEFLGQEITRENLAKVSEVVRDAFGENVFGNVLAREIESDPARVIVVDGARRADDLAALSHFPGYRLVYVESSLRTRYERIKRRIENAGEHHKTFEEFAASHSLETETHIRELKEMATEVIINEDDLLHLHAQLDALMEKIGVKK